MLYLEQHEAREHSRLLRGRVQQERVVTDRKLLVEDAQHLHTTGRDLYERQTRPEQSPDNGTLLVHREDLWATLTLCCDFICVHVLARQLFCFDLTRMLYCSRQKSVGPSTEHASSCGSNLERSKWQRVCAHSACAHRNRSRTCAHAARSCAAGPRRREAARERRWRPPRSAAAG